MGGREVADYRWLPKLATTLSPRPFLHPVRTLAGTRVTELMPADHPHHLGVSVAVPDAGGVNFWGGRTFVRGRGSVLLPNHGVQRHVRLNRQGGNVIEPELEWIAPEGAVLLRERRRVAAVPLSDTAWALDFAFALTNATAGPLGFASPQVNGRPGAGYGGFFWRAPMSKSECEGNVRVLGPGLEGEEALHGASTPWLGLNGFAPAPWTLVFIAAGGEGDPWFVRSGDYVGVGTSLALAEPLVVGPGAVLSRRIITVVADDTLTEKSMAAITETVASHPDLGPNWVPD
ncbi:PmoA family protein [Glycomyces buryatensis]|uniref:DUF6807 domain-containing protein n=1 Tax=Glycomyces buryatensis TaxID=2570927 RepID=UPI001FEA8180|nr:PmoA family protein [Glycomyces buryatensis]